MAYSKGAGTHSNSGRYETSRKKKEFDERKANHRDSGRWETSNKKREVDERNTNHRVRGKWETSRKKAERDEHYGQNNVVHDPPTSSGSGRGGKTDREWKNHKWTSRDRNDAGKWVYDYGGNVVNSNGKKDQRRDMTEYDSGSQYGIKTRDVAEKLRNNTTNPSSYGIGNANATSNPTASGSGSSVGSVGAQAIDSWLSEGLANFNFSDLLGKK